MMKKGSILLFALWFLLIGLVSCDSNSESETPDLGPDKSLNQRGLGQSANELLSAADYSALRLEIQYVEGFAPPSSSVNYLRNFLEERLNKPGGITITLNEVVSEGLSVYSIDKIREIEDEQRTAYTEGNTIAAYFYFVDGAYQTNQNVLGVAHRNTSMVIFQEKIQELSGGLGQVSTELLTSAVMAHEFAHILGLVDVGTPMVTDHKDEANGAHCDNQECLMYFAVESSSGLDDLFGMSTPPSLDTNCLADLAANGGK